ncbi:MAG: hypothetical protein OIF32_02330 [Campylobacterales bacterium]|nr:hypothetical protein [Campylobacterales bacterium]
MSLKNKIREESEKYSKTKAEILKESEEEIIELMNSPIPLKRQLELIEEELHVKMTQSEYRGILKKHFGYKGRYSKTPPTQPKQKAAATSSPAKKPKDPISALSEDVDLLAISQQKKAEKLEKY